MPPPSWWCRGRCRSGTARARADSGRVAGQARQLFEVRHEDDLDPPVLLLAGVGLVVGDRIELAVTRGREVLRRELLLDHELDDAVRARRRQVPVVRKLRRL